jgi:hypothetical protein
MGRTSWRGPSVLTIDRGRLGDPSLPVLQTLARHGQQGRASAAFKPDALVNFTLSEALIDRPKSLRQNKPLAEPAARTDFLTRAPSVAANAYPSGYLVNDW